MQRFQGKGRVARFKASIVLLAFLCVTVGCSSISNIKTARSSPEATTTGSISGTAKLVENNQTHVVALERVESNGNVTEIERINADTNDTGVLNFNFPRVENCNNANFMVVSVLDSAGNLQSRSLVAAPPPGENIEVGTNRLTTAQTNTILEGFLEASTDSAFFASMVTLFQRTPDISKDDSPDLVRGLKNIILGSNGVSEQVFDDVDTSMENEFNKSILCNDAPDERDFSDVTKLMKEANAASASEDANVIWQHTSALMGDVLIDAAEKSGIDPRRLTGVMAFAAKQSSENASIQKLPIKERLSIKLSIETIGYRLAFSEWISSYSNGIKILGAPNAQQERFANIKEGVNESLQIIYTDNALQFITPNEDVFERILSDMKNEFVKIHKEFIGDLELKNGDVSDIKTEFIEALESSQNIIDTIYGAKFGRFYQDGMSVSSMNADTWPNMLLPMGVATLFIKDRIKNGGTLEYAQEKSKLPKNMGWFNGGKGRRKFKDFPEGTQSVLVALELIKDDVAIASHKRIADRQVALLENDPLALMAIEREFVADINELSKNISGTLSAGLTLTTKYKQALMRLLIYPDLK
ncbi:MAG: hypothetical protein O3A01_01690 [bacterium]|nr:hypothetical protein [bacterium]